VVRSQADQAQVRWWLSYTDAASQRPVALHGHSELQLADGLIVQQVDCFDLWAWSRQALGTVGRILGWSDWMQAQLRAQALNRLERWQEMQACEAGLARLPS